MSVLFSDLAFGFLWLSSKKVDNNSISFFNWCVEENLELNNKDNRVLNVSKLSVW